MKKIVLLMFVLVSMTAFAQKDVTKFLGIPVDGNKTTMMQKLKAKGFKYSQKLNCLTGEFNGSKVMVDVATNNNKVWRIVIVDAIPLNETNIKIRFNNLCKQFQGNKKYCPPITDFLIPEEEDISYEMLAHNKRYEAVFYQAPDDADKFLKDLHSYLLTFFSEEELANPTDEISKKITDVGYNYMIENFSYKTVWFMIGGQYGEYKIQMYYENKYNQSDGEDL